MNNNCPLTIFIPTYNRIWGLRDSISSIQSQNFSNWRILVVDDASAEPVEEFVKSLQDPRIFFYRQKKNVGVAENWKWGIKRVNTKYFSILMDDDWYGPEFIKNRLDVFEKYKHLSMVYGPYTRIDINNNILTDILPKKNGVLNDVELVSAMISRDSFIGTTVFRTEYVQKIIDQSSNFGLIIDYAINVLVPLINKKGGYCLDSLDFFYRDHSETLSNTRKSHILKECLAMLESIKKENKEIKSLINLELYQMLKNESWNATKRFEQISWALKAVRLKPFWLDSYWNLLKPLLGNPKISKIKKILDIK